jgi:hypothetical protein
MSYISEQDADTPLSRWKFEETAGTTVDDDLTTTRDGTINGGVTLNQPAQFSGSLLGADFNGSTGYVSFGNASGLLGIGTIEIVAEFDTIPASNSVALFSHAWANGQIIPLVVGFNLNGSNAGKLQVGYFTGSVWVVTTWGTVPSTGVPYHIVGKYDGTTLALWVNGVQVASAAATTARPGTGSVNSTAYIGRRWDLAQYHDGKIWDVAIYATALSDARIGTHYNVLIDDGLAPGFATTTYMSENGNVDVHYVLSQGYGVPVAIDVTGDVTQTFNQPAGQRGHFTISGLALGATYNLTLTPSNTYGTGGANALSVSHQTNTYVDAVMQDVPVVYHPLQEASGTRTFDYSLNDHDGSYIGGYTLGDTVDTAAPAILGNHVRLDGTSGAVALDSSTWLTPASGFTFEVLLYVRTWTTSVRLFEAANGTNTIDMYFAANGSGGLTLWVNGVGLTMSRFSRAEWHHIVFAVTSSGSATVYVDGAIYAKGTVGTPTNGPRAGKYIGKSNYTTDPYLASSVTHIALYNSALSGARIMTHAETALPYVGTQIAAVTAESLTDPGYPSVQAAAVTSEAISDVTRPSAQFGVVVLEAIIKGRQPFVGWGYPI